MMDQPGFLARIGDVGVEVWLEGDTLRLRNRREIALLRRKAFDVAIGLAELTELRLVQRPAAAGILGALLMSGLLLYGAGPTTFLWMSFAPMTMLAAAGPNSPSAPRSLPWRADVNLENCTAGALPPCAPAASPLALTAARAGPPRLR